MVSASAVAWADDNELASQAQWYAPSADVEDLSLPSSIANSSSWHGGSTIDAGFAGDYWIGGSLNFGEWADHSGVPIGDTASQTVLASGFLALSGGIWGVTPYVGAGVGAAPSNGPGLAQSTPSWSLAYQGVAGLSVNWGSSLTTEIEYRYFTADELSITSGPAPDSTYQSHDVMLRIDLGF